MKGNAKFENTKTALEVNDTKYVLPIIAPKFSDRKENKLKRTILKGKLLECEFGAMEKSILYEAYVKKCIKLFREMKHRSVKISNN